MAKRIWKDPYIDVFLCPIWDVYLNQRWNSGMPFTILAIGPFRFRKWMG